METTKDFYDFYDDTYESIISRRVLDFRNSHDSDEYPEWIIYNMAICDAIVNHLTGLAKHTPNKHIAI